MNHAVVVDTSVALKWVLEEEHSDKAEALYDASVQTGTVILGPTHLIAEVTNALHQRTRRKQNGITAGEADEALSTFLSFPVQLVTSEELYPRALMFARTHDVASIYDTLFVVLAQLSDAELWTDDRALINRVGTVASWVRWIGDYRS